MLMAIRTREEILTQLRGRFGEAPTDEDIALLEDITDTVDDYENRTKDNTDWKKKHDDNDAAWRKRYRDRFFSGGGGEDDEDSIKPQVRKNLSFENLFKEG